MQFFKQAAKNVWNTSKSYVVDTRTPAQKLIDQIVDSRQQITPTSKLTELANMTYQSQLFQEITDLLLKKIKVFKYDIEQAKKTLNALIAINYIIKHGASGFIDELRSFVGYFKQYQALKIQKVYESQSMQRELDYELQKIKSRANYIENLLTDKKKLLKEKQLSMLVRQKMKIYEKNKMDQMSKAKFESINSQSYDSQQTKQSDIMKKQRLKQMMGQIDGYMEKYLWKYVDKLDDHIQSISQKVIEKIDRYVIGQIPQEGFQIDSDEQSEKQTAKKQKKLKQQKPAGYATLEDDEQLMKQLQQEGIVSKGTTNLLQFQQIQEQERKIPEISANLKQVQEQLI